MMQSVYNITCHREPKARRHLKEVDNAPFTENNLKRFLGQTETLFDTSKARPSSIICLIGLFGVMKILSLES